MQGIAAICLEIDFFFLSPLLSKKTKFPETHRSKFEEFKSVVSNFHWSLSF